MKVSTGKTYNEIAVVLGLTTVYCKMPCLQMCTNSLWVRVLFKMRYDLNLKKNNRRDGRNQAKNTKKSSYDLYFLFLTKCYCGIFLKIANIVLILLKICQNVVFVEIILFDIFVSTNKILVLMLM